MKNEKIKKRLPTIKPKIVTKSIGDGQFVTYNFYGGTEEEHYKYCASRSGEENLISAVALIKKIYAKELKENRKLGKELIIEEGYE